MPHSVYYLGMQNLMTMMTTVQQTLKLKMKTM